MRIMHLLSQLLDAGNGVVNAALDLAIQQTVEGHRVACVAASGACEKVLTEHNVAYAPIPMEFGPGSVRSLNQALRRFILEFKPDVVHAHTARSVILGRLATYGRGLPLVATAHNGLTRSSPALLLADEIIAVSEADAIDLRKLRPRHMSVVLNGSIGSQRSSPQREVSLTHPAILFVGGMYYRKGVDVLIRAFNLLKNHGDSHLYLVGDGPDKSAFETLVDRLPCRSRVHFLGFSPAPLDFMRACDIFVLPSRKEPFGLVLAEARAVGCAIIGSNTGGIPQVLENGDAGILVPPDDPGALCSTLDALLSNDELRQRYKAAATKNLEWLRLDRVSAETKAVYDRAIERQNLRHGSHLVGNG